MRWLSGGNGQDFECSVLCTDLGCTGFSVQILPELDLAEMGPNCKCEYGRFCNFVKISMNEDRERAVKH